MKYGPLVYLLLAATTAAQAQEPPAPVAAPVADVDVEAPLVIEVSIAADNPKVAPVITASLKDNVGVQSAVAWWRVAGQPWQSVPFIAAGPMFMARLPAGTQTTGFSVWMEIKDAAGNVSRVGAEAAPLEVPPALEGNRERVERQAEADVAFAGPHPAWVMLAIGTGIAATAGAGIFVYDLNVLAQRGEQVDDLLADDDISDTRRVELEATRVAIDRTVTQDTAITATLAVIGGVALATGAVLLTVAAIEQ